jgi:putative membrane protein
VGSRKGYFAFLLISYGALLLWSVIHPHDYFTWFLEVLPALAGLAIMLATYRRFPLSNLFYALAWVHAIILTIGAHYTYAEVPLFNWLRDILGTQRNSYDGIGHFAQGFMPAIYTREILLRKTPLKSGGWLFVIIVSICLAVSAVYELIEWGVAEATDTAADAFLGAQGDPWDTQKDMALCWIGSIVSLLTLSRVHDRSLQKLGAINRAPTI